MLIFSLVISTPSAGVHVVQVPAESAEDATQQFETDNDNAGCEILHIIEPESIQVEVVVDLTGGVIQQVLSNHANTKIIFLDSHKDEIAYELESEGGMFAPDMDLNDDPAVQPLEPWVYRESVVEHNPKATRHYVGYAENDTARQAFNEKVYEALNN